MTRISAVRERIVRLTLARSRYLVVISVSLNLLSLILIGVVIHGRGGLAYLKAYVTHNPAAKPDAGYSFRVSLFQLSAVDKNSRPIVFVGDSMTAEGNWSEFFGGDVPILNRGIGGDTTIGVLRRIEQVSVLKPRAVFLMIGTNDAQALGHSPPATARVIARIVGAIRRDSPQTRVYLESLLPTVAPRFVAWSDQVNRLIAPLADNQAVFFLNCRQDFLEHGLLAAKLTRDGIHLSPEGYARWISCIAPVMFDITQSHTPVRRTDPQVVPEI